MGIKLALAYLTAIICGGVLLISSTVTAQNLSLPINTTNSTQMNETSGLSNFTDLTDTSATGNVSENLRGIYNTTQANNAMMSDDRQLVPFVKKYLMGKTILFHYPHFRIFALGSIVLMIIAMGACSSFGSDGNNNSNNGHNTKCPRREK